MKERAFHTDSFTRGGQIFSHEWRMRLQNMKMVMALSSLCAIAGFMISISWFKISLWSLWDFWFLSYVGGHLKVTFWPFIKWLLRDADYLLKIFFKGSKGIASSKMHVQHLITTLSHHKIGHLQMKTLAFLNHPWTLREAAKVHQALWGMFGFWIVGMLCISYGFKKKSQKIEEEKIIKGTTQGTLSQVSQLVKKQGKPEFTIAPHLPIPLGTENQHFAIIGATRMGKTNCMLGMLQQIRNKGQRAIILDSTGEFTSYFYREGIDVLLNPLDSRSPSWDIWQENLATHEYDAWAASLVPQGKSDPVWHETARKLLSFTTRKLSTSNASMKDILKWSCWEPLGKRVEQFYANSPVSSIMRYEAEKTTVGVRMQLASNISAFEYLKSGRGEFSITRWVSHYKETDQWLFLTSLPSQRNTLAPLLASWFNFAFLGLERAGVDFKNRLWMVADELTGLDYQISSLKRVVTEGAKYGACCMLGFQNKSQIDHLYGHAITKTLLSNCSTKVIFRSPDHETAKDLSLTLGEQEVISSTENFSIGAHHMRDGVNLASHQRTKAAISATDIMGLNPLEAYIMLPGELPTTKAKYKINKMKQIASSFVDIN
jgi:type IV conjugative transfer system coupling protein TraD